MKKNETNQAAIFNTLFQLLRHTRALNVSDLRLWRCLVRTRPPAEKARLEGVLQAGTERNMRANFDSNGYFLEFSFQYTRGSRFPGSRGS